MVFRLIASLLRECFGQKNQMSKGVDQVLEFKQYFLAYFMRNLASNTPKVSVLRALCQHRKGVILRALRHYKSCNL